MPSETIFQPLIRILAIEDDKARIQRFRSWVDDDIRVVWARSVGKALGILDRDRGQVYQGILLDHDLDTNAVTPLDAASNGQQVVKSILENVSRIVPILVHSTNKKFGSKMANDLAEAGFYVARIPFNKLSQHAFEEFMQDVRAFDEQS